MRQELFIIQVPLSEVPSSWLEWVALGTREFMNKPIHTQIAASIALAIEQAGFKTQDEFARVIDMDRSTLRRVLSGKYDPKLSTLQRIAEGLEISVDRLLQTASPSTKPLLQKRGRKPKESPQVVQIQLVMAPGEDLPEWLKMALEQGKAQAFRAGKKG